MVERVIVGPWKTNCYIYSSSKKECIIIDPGGDEEEIASRVDVLNMVPVGIALTHGHVDHLAALGRLRDNYAARGYTLPIGISSADRKFLGTGAVETHRESLKVSEIDEFAFLAGDSPELPKADVKLREGQRVFDMDLVVLETPGHTPGSLCFYSEKEGVLFSGDTLFFDGVGRTDLPGGSDKKLRDSIQKKIAVLPPETRVFPGHGPFTTVERERRGNAFFREPAPEPRRPEPARPAHRPVGAKRPLRARAGGAKKARPLRPARPAAKRVRPKGAQRRPAPPARAAHQKTARPRPARPKSARARLTRPARLARAVKEMKPVKALRRAFSKNGHSTPKSGSRRPARARAGARTSARAAVRRTVKTRPAARAKKKSR